MGNDRDKGEGLVSEGIVQLLFSQVKSSNDGNTEAIKELTVAITALLKVVGSTPSDTISKLDKIIAQQGKILANFSRFFWSVGIIMGVITIVITIVTFLRSWYPQGPPTNFPLM